MSSVIVLAAHRPTLPNPCKVYSDNIIRLTMALSSCMGIPKKPDGRVADTRCSNSSRPTLLRPLLRMLSSWMLPRLSIRTFVRFRF